MPARRTKSTPRTKTVRRSAPAPDRRSPTLPEVWERFATQLQQCVNDLDTDDILILARKRANQYVQLHHWGFAITAEAASNAYIIPPTALLDERQYARAKALGWAPPTITLDTLREVYKVRCPSELHYKSFTTDGSQQIRWTALGIKRELL